jgi:pimeloyl-ACP methyl ester carboxylesterase
VGFDVRSPQRALLGVGAGLAAAGVGAALGLAAERWTAGRAVATATVEAYGSLRGVPVDVPADDGTRLYAEVDEADGPPGREPALTVVFSHGFALSQDIWHHQRQWLRGQYRLVFWDQRGHGRSGTGPDEHYTVEQCGRDLRAVIEATAPAGPIVLVGHSMGGMTVMALAADDPGLVRERLVGLALVATSSGQLGDVTWGLTGPVGRLAHRVAPRALAGLTRAPRLVDRTRRIGSDLEQLLVKKYSFASPVSAELVRFTAAMIAGTPIDVVSGFLPDFDRHDRADALAVLGEVESLVLSGDRDLLTPPEHSEVIAGHLPGAERVLVTDAGHLVMLEHPGVTNVALADLLVRAGRPRPPSGRLGLGRPRRRRRPG